MTAVKARNVAAAEHEGVSCDTDIMVALLPAHRLALLRVAENPCP